MAISLVAAEAMLDRAGDTAPVLLATGATSGPDELIIGVEPQVLPPAAPARVVHQVVIGEYLEAIAARYQTSVAEIVRENRLTSTILTPGQELQIPLITDANTRQP